MNNNNYFYLPTVILLVSVLSFSISRASGQDIPVSDQMERILEEEFRWLKAEAFDMEVTTASRKFQKISDAPATIISITQDEIRAYGRRDLKDIFRALPGIDVSYNVQGEIKTLVSMRGVLGNQKILILQDGHKYSPETGERFIYAHNIPLNIYQRIEIIYGPASSLYGADAYAGVINLITKHGGDYNGAEINMGYLSTHAYTADFSVGKKISDDADFLISARIIRGEDEKLHETYEEYAGVHSYQGDLKSLSHEYPIKNWNFFCKFRYHKFTMGFDWQHELESNAAVSLPQNYGYVENSVWGQDLRHFYMDHQSYSGENLNIKTTLEAGDFEVNPATNFYIVATDEDGNPTGGTPAYKYAQSSYIKGRIQADWDITEKLSLVSGISYGWVESFPKTRNLDSLFSSGGQPEVDMSSFVDSQGYTFGILGFEEPVFEERNYTNFGLFVQAEYKFSDRFKLDGGIRYDYNSIYKETFNPRIGMIINPLGNLTVKLLYGTAYIQPANHFRYENFANPFIMHIPNEDLEPEKLENYSLDISYTLAKHFFIHGALFINKMENIILPVAAPAQTDNYPYYNPYRSDPGYVQYNGNQGEIESRGGEITLKHKFREFSTGLSYSYVTGEEYAAEEDDWFDIPQISCHKITLNSSYTGEKFTAGLTLRYYSDVSTDRNNYKYGSSQAGGDETYFFDGSTVAYLNMIYQLNKHVSLHLSIDNLFDTEHYGAVPFDGSPVVVPRAPQPLRKTYIGLQCSF
jgi:outer membrane receptor for ferrienterochelin and colicin